MWLVTLATKRILRNPSWCEYHFKQTSETISVPSFRELIPSNYQPKTDTAFEFPASGAAQYTHKQDSALPSVILQWDIVDLWHVLK